MADIKLSYFNIRARAEVARLILAYAGVNYDDERLSGEEFAARKPSLLYGQLPKLTYNGVEIYQSMGIARFLAKEFDLSGRTNLEEAQADEIGDAVLDMMNARVKIIFEKDEKTKTELKNKLLGETLPKGLAQLEKVLHARGGQFMAGNALTWADFQIFHLNDWVGEKNLLKDFPGLKNLCERVAGLPNIAKYLQSRPVTEL